MTWKHFPHYCPFCEGNPLVVTSGSPHNGPIMWSFDIFFDVIFNKFLKSKWVTSDLRHHSTQETSLYPYNESFINGVMALSHLTVHFYYHYYFLHTVDMPCYECPMFALPGPECQRQSVTEYCVHVLRTDCQCQCHAQQDRHGSAGSPRGRPNVSPLQLTGECCNLAHDLIDVVNSVHAKFQREHKHIFTLYVIPPHSDAIGSWNSSCIRPGLAYFT